MRIVGIDPGSHRTGWGIIDRHGSRLSPVAFGVIGAGDGPLESRLKRIADELDEILTRHEPHAMALETVFHARNAQSALILGHARGVVLLSAARSSVPVFEYTAGQIKQAVTGKGRADKEQVQAMVRLLLHLETHGPIGLDASDALAAAVCHDQMASSRVAGLEPKRRRGSSFRSRPGGPR